MKKRSRIVIQPKSNSEQSSKIRISPANANSNRKQSNSSAKKKWWNNRLLLFLLLFLLLLSIAGIILFVSQPKSDKEPIEAASVPPISTDQVENKAEESSFFIPNLDTSDYKFDLDVISSTVSIQKHFIAQGLSSSSASALEQAAKKYQLNQFEQGHDFIILTHKKNQQELFIYKQDNSNYLSFDPVVLEVKRHTLNIETRQKTAAAIIRDDLWSALENQGVRSEILDQMEEALKWSVDFYHLQPNDRFKIIYEEKWSGDQFIEVGNHGKEHFAICVEEKGKIVYYDNFGHLLEQTFLLSPVKYGRISSPYNLKRRHPLLDTIKPHLGTDYAAPIGTPIRAVADGTVTHTRFTKNNGNYVKIKHDHIYETQYLHLQNFHPQVKEGTKVHQGQTIGYVGVTGSTSGPHVCFRFWKNKKQVDHLKEDLTQTRRISIREEGVFLKRRDALFSKLMDLPYK